MLYMVTGGSGSGKSRFAEDTAIRLAREYGCGSLIYIAAMEPWGREAEERIKRHRLMRSGKGFETIERYYDINGIDLPSDCAALLECVPNLAANELFGQKNKLAAVKTAEDIIALSDRCRVLIAVTGNVFDDGLEYSPETTEYIRVLARINSALAAAACNVWEVVCGIGIRIK